MYYRVKHGVWMSLRTANRREAIKRLRDLEAQELMAKAMEKLGVLARLGAIEERVADLRVPAHSDPLAPWTANPARRDFATELGAEMRSHTEKSRATASMWKTTRNNLIDLLSTVSRFEELDLTGKDEWRKFEELTPAGVWTAYRLQPKASCGAADDRAETTGNSSANHMASFLRRFIPGFVEKGFLPPSFIKSAQNIGKLTVHAREPKIPTPDEMEEFLRACDECDNRLGELLRFLAYSGARKGVVFDRSRAVTWDDVDFDAAEITLRQKGDVRRTVPMGPQLKNLLLLVKQRQSGNETDQRIFPFGSGREDRALELMKEVSARLGGPVADMTMFHVLKHYHKTQHQRQGTENRVSDFLTFNSPSEREGSGAIYRHDIYAQARIAVERVRL